MTKKKTDKIFWILDRVGLGRVYLGLGGLGFLGVVVRVSRCG